MRLKRWHWLFKFALFAPVFTLALALAVHGVSFCYERQIQRRFAAALASFDPETTEFTIQAEDWLNGVSGEKTSAQLTPEQRQMVKDWIESFRFEKVSYDGITSYGSSFYVKFESPQGQVWAGGGSILLAPYRPSWLFRLVHPDFIRYRLQQIEAEGIGSDSAVKPGNCCAYFHIGRRDLSVQLWKSPSASADGRNPY